MNIAKVREAASRALGQVAQAAPALAAQVLSPLRDACKDSDEAMFVLLPAEPLAR